MLSNFSSSTTTHASVTLPPGTYTITLEQSKKHDSGAEWTGYAGQYYITAMVIKK